VETRRSSATAVTVGQLLAQARAAGVERLDAQLLIAHRLGRPRTWVIAHDDAVLTQLDVDVARAWLSRRAAGEPLAYLLGWKEFHGRRLAVTPAVLIPRPDTEVLVDWAIELLAGPLRTVAAPQVVDLGTGSGAIALALKAALPDTAVTATDISADALAVAQANATALGLAVTFRHGDWWEAVDAARYDIALANAPYVAIGDPHLGALGHEPALALESGADGLEAIRAIVAGAMSHLRDGGWLLLEHGDDQQPAIAALLERNGFERIGLLRDLAGQRRCTGARRGGPR
jgi:release factor glutamine methyltransferase